jgi:membrane-bound ClpP family serine protease
MMDWLKQIAPTIATAFGGPLAGLAVDAISKAIGIDPKDVNKTIADGKLSADQILAIKQAEIAMAARAQELGLDFETIAVDDRKSAREMQSKTLSWIPGLMAIVVTLGFFGILIGLMTNHFQTSDALMLMLGSLGTAWTGIIAFYFGSSAGSQRKDELLHQSEPSK